MISITVAEINDAPVLDPIGNKQGGEGALLTFTASAFDSDAPQQNLTFSLQGTVPAGASLDANTGVFTWTPAEGQGPGSYPLTVRVTDNGSPPRNDSESITITVSEVNTAPLLGSIGPKSITEGRTLSFTATATDADLPAQTLVFSLDAGAPAGATIGPSTGLFQWTPPAGYAPATNQVTVRISDNGSPVLNDFETISIVVLGRPRITGITPPSGGQVTIQWQSGIGSTYRVQRSADLINWSDLNPAITATAVTSSFTDTAATGPQRLYRVVLIN
jgi:hypothetical protein